MTSDPIIEQVRQTRLDIERQCAGKDAYYQLLRKTQDQHRGRLTRLKVRPAPLDQRATTSESSS
ncbi:MAG: hypothetical protein IT440_09705 [Phycisphaeraceae bacterium]|nr:hypothetical protein [Phycisphaeraceae bacterium]